MKYIILLIVIFLGGYVVGHFSNKPTTSITTISATPSTFPTATADQQRRCGIDAREFMKSKSIQTLSSSSFITKLQAYVVYIKNIDFDKSRTMITRDYIYNVATNELLGGFDSSEYKTCPSTTPEPTINLSTHTVTPGNPFIDVMSKNCYPNSGYWYVTPENPEVLEDVSYSDYDAYLQSLGLHS